MLSIYQKLRRKFFCGFLGGISKNIYARKGVRFGSAVTLVGSPVITIYPGSVIDIGDRGNLCSDSWYTALGVNHPVVLRTLSQAARIDIGPEVGMSGVTICAYTSVSIGEKCLIGANVIITDTDFHPVVPEGRRTAPVDAAKSLPVSIGRNVFLGANSIVLKGVSIGENTVVGAGSVVSKSLPANVIAAGNPAKPVASI